MAFFLYPHAITGVLASRGAKTVRRNMSMLPLYSILSGFVALLGFMALAANIKPLNGNLVSRNITRVRQQRASGSAPKRRSPRSSRSWDVSVSGYDKAARARLKDPEFRVLG